MSARQRSARPSATPVRSSAIRPNQSSRNVQLPAYTEPIAPLNAKAQSDLERLQSQCKYAEKIKQFQNQATEHLTRSASTINEKATDRKADAARLNARVQRLEAGIASSQQPPSSQQNYEEQEDGDGENEQAMQSKKGKAQADYDNEEKYVADFSKRSAEATAQAEEALRGVIDAKAKMEAREKILTEVSGNVVRGEGRIAPTQSTLGASQFRTQRNLDDEDDEGEGDRLVGSVLNAVKQRVEEKDAEYDGLSLRARYAEHNDYIGFKGSVHDAIHQDDGTRLPPASQWFSNERDGDGDIQMQTGATPDEDVDSDIEVAREVIGTKCPLTLKELEDALTSPCNHNFEAFAIKEMIQNSSEYEGGQAQGRRRGANLGDKIIRCPVTSCQTRFTEKDLRVDRLMRRRIERIQERNRREEEGEGDRDDYVDGVRQRAVPVFDDGSIPSRVATPAVKAEPKSSMAARAFSSVRSTPGLSVSGVNEDDEMDEDYDEDEEDD